MQIVKRTAKVLTTADGEDEQSDEVTSEIIAYYQNDHLGTPQEITDSKGQVVWSANYQAWGEAKAAIDKAAQAAGIDNQLRFQGQYLDEETGLHYNRHRYYDPHSGRFVSNDPIKLAGGNNLQVYAPNPTMWVDPLGLCGCDVVYRGDSRSPNTIFNEGFSPRGNSTDLYAHALDQTNPPSNFISTSKSQEIGKNFASGQAWGEPRNGFMYTIDKPTNGIDVNTTLGSRSPYPFEEEIAIPGKINPSQIKGATPVSSDGAMGNYSILNPNYYGF